MTSKYIKLVILVLLVWCTGPGLASGTESRLVHVVLVWLKDPGNADHITQIIDTTREFSSIQGVKEIRVGRSVPSQRLTTDDSFDVGLYMVFSSKKELEAYLVHPKHQEAQRSILRPLARKAVIYDFRDDGT